MGGKIVSFGEALWDLLPDGPVLGGAPFNFAYRARSLGNEVSFISRLGADDLGREAREKIEALGLTSEYIQEDRIHPTGTVHVTLDEDKNPDYTIVEEVAYDYTEYTERLSGLAKDADCFCFGSVTQRAERARNTLYSLLDDYPGRFALFDINLRKNCYSKETVLTSLHKTNILKLNEDELHELKRLFSLRGSSIRDLARELLENHGLSHCLVTLGDKGLYALDSADDQVYVPAFRVNLVDPIGSGDACTAGFIDCLLKGESLADSCRFAAAIGAVVAEQSGATVSVTREQVERMLRSGVPSVPHREFA